MLSLGHEQNEMRSFSGQISRTNSSRQFGTVVGAGESWTIADITRIHAAWSEYKEINSVVSNQGEG